MVKRNPFEGDFIESSDLMTVGSCQLTISEVTPPGVEKSADGRLIDKGILSFKGTPKRLVIGKTNERLIKAMFGAKASDWVGQKITIQVRYLIETFGEYNVPTLRVVLTEGVAMPFGCRRWYGADKPFTSQQIDEHRKRRR